MGGGYLPARLHATGTTAVVGGIVVVVIMKLRDTVNVNRAEASLSATPDGVSPLSAAAPDMIPPTVSERVKTREENAAKTEGEMGFAGINPGPVSCVGDQ